MQQGFLIIKKAILIVIFLGIASTSSLNAKSRSSNSDKSQLLQVLVEQAKKQSLNLVISPEMNLRHSVNLNNSVYLNNSITNLQDRDNLIELNNLLNTLNIHALINDKTLRLIPLTELKNMPGKLYSESSEIQDSEWVYASFKVNENICVGKLVPMLRTLMPKHAHLAKNQQQNSMIIFDRKANIEKIKALIKSIESLASKSHPSCNQVLKIANDVSKKTS